MTTARDATPARLLGLPSWLINHLALHAERIIWEAFAAAGAKRYHYALLAALAESGPVSQASLSRRTGIDTSYIVGSVTELAAAGHVDRVPDPADRRRNVITLTARGERRLRELDEVVAAAQDTLTGPLSADERARLVGLLNRLVAHHSGQGAQSGR